MNFNIYIESDLAHEQTHTIAMYKTKHTYNRFVTGRLCFTARAANHNASHTPSPANYLSTYHKL